MEMNDNTILRIKVPAHLYESVKAQLSLNEAKGKGDAKKLGFEGGTVISDKGSKGSSGGTKTSDSKPRAASERPKKTSDGTKKTKKDANAHVRVHKGESPGDNIPNYDPDIPGMGLTEKKELGLEEWKQLAELLGKHIAKLEEKAAKKEEKAPVEEKKEADDEQEGQE